MKRPHNHVTSAVAERAAMIAKRASPEVDLPVLDVQALAALTHMYPPRCKGVTETEADHQRYAGKVDLVQTLVGRAEVAMQLAEGDLTDDAAAEYEQSVEDALRGGEPAR